MSEKFSALERTNMKITNKLTIVAVFAAMFAISTTLFAQESNNDAKMEKKIAHRVEKMTKKLNLTDAQVTQVKAILEESKPQMKADWQKMKAAPKDQRQAIKADLKKDKDAVKINYLPY